MLFRSLPFTVPASISGQTVQMSCNVTQGAGLIRKNGSGTWGTSVIVQNGDIVTIKQTASSSYNTTLSSQITLQGPPAAGPNGNPTAGPADPTFANQTATITIKTRNARVDPYPFRAEHVYQAELGTQYVRSVPIEEIGRAHV